MPQPQTYRHYENPPAWRALVLAGDPARREAICHAVALRGARLCIALEELDARTPLLLAELQATGAILQPLPLTLRGSDGGEPEAAPADWLARRAREALGGIDAVLYDPGPASSRLFGPAEQCLRAVLPDLRQSESLGRFVLVHDSPTLDHDPEIETLEKIRRGLRARGRVERRPLDNIAELPERRDRARCRLRIRGRVQGVGFRPFVYRLARQLQLVGHVGNDSHGVFAEIEGERSSLEEFQQRLESKAPPLARIQRVESRELISTGENDFRIAGSATGQSQEAELTPDAATCADCRRELLDPADRRHRYPFINCTNCGPRYSIIKGVPYDRPQTTMRAFTMCPRCQAEYDDPADRRFHAQPNACPDCGPRLWLTDPEGRELPGDPIRLAAERLQAGEILAIKGIGGFHLACRADDPDVVARLREKKGRDAKPFAIMVRDLDAARQLAEIDPDAARLLQSPARPIVLLPPLPHAPVAPNVAPETPDLGILLPYAPQQILLFEEGLGPLVMTSGNPSEEPLCADNDEALRRLAPMAQAFLLHDRPIARRVDDSVLRAAAPHPIPIRRARGYAPEPIRLARPARRPLLALGGELKSAVCLAHGHDAILSEHLGELANPAAFRNFLQTIEQFQRLLRQEPRIVAHDLHPDYAATRHAHKLPADIRRLPVQHHHAHLLACAAEHGIDDQPALGLVCDGTGYGSDGAIWGCEILFDPADGTEFQRLARLRYYPLIGGDATARDGWRPALALLRQIYGEDWPAHAPHCAQRIDPQALELAQTRLRRAEQDPAAAPQCSSLGRLFDAVAFLIGICDNNLFEARAAMALEAAAWRHKRSRASEDETREASPPPDTPGDEINPAPLLARLLDGRQRGESPEALALLFHRQLATLLGDRLRHLAEKKELQRVLLSGGCFANRLLLDALTKRLQAAGLEVLSHRQTPTGDGCIALGQAVAAARIREDN